LNILVAKFFTIVALPQSVEKVALNPHLAKNDYTYIIVGYGLPQVIFDHADLSGGHLLNKTMKYFL
jgi:hypothetical protein